MSNLIVTIAFLLMTYGIGLQTAYRTRLYAKRTEPLLSVEVASSLHDSSAVSMCIINQLQSCSTPFCASASASVPYMLQQSPTIQKLFHIVFKSHKTAVLAFEASLRKMTNFNIEIVSDTVCPWVSCNLNSDSS